MLRISITLWTVVGCLSACYAQTTDAFSDGDFSANPPWSGNTSKFAVVSNQLKLNDLTPSSNNLSYLSTPSISIASASWEFFIALNFNPSSTNLARVYLVSDQPDLTGSLNGYFVSMGDTGDEICLYRQTGTTRTKIIEGMDGRLNLAAVNARVLVTRSLEGSWSLSVDVGSTGNYTEEGTVVDNNFLVSSHVGLLCVYTSTRSTHFTFDDLVVTGIPQPDETPPTVVSVLPTSSNELTLLFSEDVSETQAEALLNYTGDAGLGHPASAQLQDDFKTVLLSFEESFVNGFEYQLTIENVSDVAGNTIATNTHPNFRFFVPVAAEFQDLVVNELFPDASPQVGLPTGEFVEIFNRSAKAFDLSGWKLKDATSQTTLPSHFLLPGEYLLLCATASAADYGGFGSALGLAGMPTLNNSGDQFYFVDATGLVVDSVWYSSDWYQDEDKAQGGFTLERLNPGGGSNEPSNWRASIAATGGTPGQQNSVFGLNPDNHPPELVTLQVLDATHLQLTFNEPIVFPSGEIMINNEVHIPLEQEIINGGESLILTFAPFVNGVRNTLALVNLSDLAGNLLSTDREFLYFLPAPVVTGGILFNEIMYDPSPVVQMPEVEYLEIVNTTDGPIDLGDWMLADATDTTVISSYILLPHHYLILASTAGVTHFANTIERLGIVGFPSLNNSGERILLMTPDGVVIDSVHYRPLWLQDIVKSEGGWSLERLSFNMESSESTNWRASISADGGTPGYQNALFGANPDIVRPEVVSAEVIDSLHVRISFNEELSNSSLDVSKFEWVPATGFSSSVEINESSSALTLTLASSLVNGSHYQLVIHSVSDLAGNVLQDTVSFLYFVSVEPSAGDVLLNEIMFDPVPVVQLPEAEFLEIYNNTIHPFDLAGWKLADATDTVQLKTIILLPGDYLILCSGASLSSFAPLGKSLAVTGFPGLNNSGERLMLLSPAGVVIDSVTYRPAWLQQAEKLEGGWSLERLQFTMASSEPTNWRASIDNAGGTPGSVNSLFGSNPDIIAPALIAVEVVSEKQINLEFSEHVTNITPVASHFFVLDGEAPFEYLSVDANKTIELYFESAFANGVAQQLVVNNVMDLAGNSFSDTISFRYFEPIDPTPGDIIFNEIMFDPSPIVQLPEAEYIEVYNPSAHPFDLKGWQLADGTDTVAIGSHYLLPGAHMILTGSTAASSFAQYGEVVSVSGFPSLNNLGERLMLLSKDGTVIDSVHYNPTWLQDTEKQEGGWSLERLQDNLGSSDPANWRASVDPSGGTPGSTNSVDGQNPDNKPPQLISLEVKNNHELELAFSEAMLSDLVEELTNYQVTPEVGHPSSAITSNSNMLVKLHFENSFRNGSTYHLQASNLEDENENSLGLTDVEFTFFVERDVSPKDVIVTEIMADPTPSVLLPEVEYVEIYNRTADPVDLKDWILSDGSSHAKLPHYLLQANTFVTIASNTSALGLQSYGATLGVPNFPSLNNTGEALVLRNRQGVTIDSVNYQLSWYRSSEKEDGGWSLELIDAENGCGEEDNWAASEAEAGGTPSQLNSITANKPDLTGPRLVGVIPVSPLEVIALFNEKLEDPFTGSFEFLPLKEIADVSFKDRSIRAIVLTLSSPLEERTLFTLKASVKDCSGNPIAPEFSSVDFALTERPETNDVVISEVLFNPLPNGVDFVEVVNRSPKYFNLKGWKIGNDQVFDNRRLLTEKDVVLPPGGYAAFTGSPAQLENQYPSSKSGAIFESSLPAFPDDEGFVVIADSLGTALDSLVYEENFHSPLLQDTEGVSLERILLRDETNLPSNWTSALKSAGYATPGYLNSNSLAREESFPQAVYLEPEIISTLSPFTLIHYQFDYPGLIANMRILDVQGREVAQLAGNEPLGQTGFYRWDGQDANGHKARPGYYILWLELIDLSGHVETFRRRIVVRD